VLLCKLINVIQPGSVKKINKGSFAFKQIDNIGMFLRGCEALGMPRADCFSANDLYQGDNMKKVLACLDSLGGLCQ
ncbi:hypothetical protein AURANDRAFT_7830, partial [Aureococcus anophagefferens]